jgi:hypothetical protein
MFFEKISGSSSTIRRVEISLRKDMIVECTKEEGDREKVKKEQYGVESCMGVTGVTLYGRIHRDYSLFFC